AVDKCAIRSMEISLIKRGEFRCKIFNHWVTARKNSDISQWYRTSKNRLPSMIRALVFLALLIPCLNVSASNFPRPAALEPAVQFWIKVYTRISTSQGYVHDDENLSVIYETVDLPTYASRADRDSQVTAATRRVADALNALAHGKRKDLSPVEAEVLAAWPP